MFTIETERDGLKEQTLKKYVLQGKIRLTVNIKHNNKKNVEEEEEREKWDISTQEQIYRKKKSIIRYVENSIFRIYIQ